MAAAAVGNAARSEAEARAARLEAKLRALEEQKEVPASAVGPVLKLLVALADSRPKATEEDAAAAFASLGLFPFKAHRAREGERGSGLVRPPPECFDVPPTNAGGGGTMLDQCRPYTPYGESYGSQ